MTQYLSTLSPKSIQRGSQLLLLPTFDRDEKGYEIENAIAAAVIALRLKFENQ